MPAHEPTEPNEPTESTEPAEPTASGDPTAGAFRGRGVCVTGGAGFIGSHLVDALVEQGARVSVLDDCSTGRRSNLRRHLDGNGTAIRFVEGSILDPAALDEAMAGVDLVYHQAAVTSVPRSVEQPAETMRTNVTGTLEVLEAARRAAARRVVYASSSSVYGNPPVGGETPKQETLRPDPQSPYAASKLTGEHLLRSWAICYGLQTCSIRYFNVFGARQRADSTYAAVIPRFGAAYRAGERPVIYGDGRQTRDFTHVSNVVRGNLLAGSSDARLDGGAVNVACGDSVSVLELARLVAATLGVEPAWDHAEARVGEVLHSRADVTLARDLLGYEPVIGLEEGLRRTLLEGTD